MTRRKSPAEREATAKAFRAAGISPGCKCTVCRRAREKYRRTFGSPTPSEGGIGQNNNMGRVQHGASEKGWSDGGSENPKEGKLFGFMTSAERADREEREAHGRELPAAYRHMIGPTPNCLPGDKESARIYHNRILAAIEHGGWTRSEWQRLYKLRDKWKARAEGTDQRFKEVGNRQGGLTKQETTNVKQRRIVEAMQRELANAFKSSGD